jgi:hypothetical protein
MITPPNVTRKEVIEIEVRVEEKGHSDAWTAAGHVRTVTGRGGGVRKFSGNRLWDTHDGFVALSETGTETVIKTLKSARS